MMTNKMLKVILLVMLTTALLVAGCITVNGQNGTNPGPAPQVGESAPDFQLQSLDGQTVSLSGFQGQPVLINFWQTTCVYCRDEMPFLQQVYEEWSARGLVVLTIDIAESSSTVTQFMQSNHLSLLVLLDSRAKVAQEYGIGPIPTTFLIDSDGIIREKRIGYFPSVEAIENSLSKIIL